MPHFVGIARGIGAGIDGVFPLLRGVGICRLFGPCLDGLLPLLLDLGRIRLGRGAGVGGHHEHGSQSGKHP